MNLLITLLCFIPLISTAQSDTCITTRSSYIETTTWGKMNKDGNWTGQIQKVCNSDSTNNQSLWIAKYRNGKACGKDRQYFRGSGMCEYVLVQEMTYRNGKDWGRFTFWDIEGHLLKKGRHRNGYGVGKWTEYDISGAIIWIKKYKRKFAYTEKRFVDGQIHYQTFVDTKKNVRREQYFGKEGEEVNEEAYRAIWKGSIY